ncbi:MinD/ParA family ATP-binding protein [Curtobacterium flaccumfaciens]|uniref:MinD/ParA family ATP-binding protein n=1 Tax=Curtobacterium flaccumfaciens TaxID=2035 RepID=UPI00188BF49F|nr:AAA family ATPase [Curtobacterium flaccumfaciens]MBF4629333.1 AAA family ATPase [Curtobacterium flaccumfaciens]
MPNSTVHVDYTLIADQGTLTIGETTFTGESAYPEAMDYLRDVATHLGNAVIVHSHDRGTGQDTLFSIDGHGAISPVTGTVEASATVPSPWEASGAASAPGSVPPAPQSPPVGVAAPVVAPAVPTSVQAAAAAATEHMQPTRREARQSFLTQEQVEEPATTGFRGFLTGLGLRMAPSAAERRHREQVHLVSQHHVGPRTIMLANGKGGAGKTLATVCLSTVLTRHSGAATVAWDNNQTRGTLGWSTEAARHDASVLDLLPEIDRLLGTEARSADMAEYVHHQTRDRYDVLKSKPDILAAEQRFGAETVDRVHKVLTKFYRLVLIDSGNDETDPMWLAGLDRTDQLVVPTTTDDKWCESAALLLEQLMGAGGRYRELAENAVVIVGVETSDVKPEKVTEQVRRFKDAGLGRDVLTIPYDAGLKARIINFDALQESTKLAWLAAGAAVAKGL